MKNKMTRTLRGQFFLITISLMLVFGIGAATLSYLMFSNSLRSNSIHTAETNLQFMRNEINSNLESVLELSRWSRTNTDIVNYISSSSDSYNYTALTKQAVERLTEEYIGTTANQYISRIIIANSEGSKFLQRYLSSAYSVDRNVIDIIKSLPYYEELLYASDYTFSIGVQEDPFSRRPEQMLPIIRPIESLYGSDMVGISFIQISFSMFTGPLERFSRQEGIPVYLTIGPESYRISGAAVTPVPQAEESELIDSDDTTSRDSVVQRITENGRTDIYVSSPPGSGGLLYYNGCVGRNPEAFDAGLLSHPACNPCFYHHNRTGYAPTPLPERNRARSHDQKAD